MNAAHAKVEREGRCRVCGDRKVEHLDAAHTWDRSLGATGYADPDLIVPLCSKIKGGTGCHDAYDSASLDLLPYLTLAEQLALVRAAGGIERARDRAIGRRPVVRQADVDRPRELRPHVALEGPPPLI